MAFVSLLFAQIAAQAQPTGSITGTWTFDSHSVGSFGIAAAVRITQNEGGTGAETGEEFSITFSYPNGSVHTATAMKQDRDGGNFHITGYMGNGNYFSIFPDPADDDQLGINMSQCGQWNQDIFVRQ